jgi:cardiolipin synthase A/B
VLDGLNVFFSGNRARMLLEPYGGEVLFFKKWFHRIHRKLLIVDESIAFVGGVNLGYHRREFIDLHVRISGRFAKRLLSSFSYSYARCGGKDIHLLDLANAQPAKRTLVSLSRAKHHLLEHWPVRGKRALKDYYISRISLAKQRIVVASPYFIPHRWLLKILVAAIRRNVRVEILIPEYSDIFISTLANIGFARRLSSLGFHFYFTRAFLHAKVLLIDDHEGMVGSNNIDALSFDFNVEAGLTFNHKGMIGDVRKILDEWKSESMPYEKTKHAGRWYNRPIEWLATFLRPIL